MFVILTHPRTGSELLATALGQHPELDVASELLNPRRPCKFRPDLPFKEHVDLDVPVSTMIFDQTQDLAAFVEVAFQSVDGFKITYDQINTTSPVIQKLKDNHIKVIFMERNCVESAISYWFAIKSQRWQRHNGEHLPEDKPSWVDPNFVQSFCLEAKENARFYKEAFSGHQKICIVYDDLIARWSNVIDQICDFLDVSRFTVSKPLDKRLFVPLDQLVLNYHQLKAFI